MDTFASYWRDRDITIDGDQNDWQDKLWVLERENMAIGIMNDDANLYVTLSTSDRNTIRQIMRLGFTVWFDPEGGTKEVLGIKYPGGGTGMRPMGSGSRARESRPDPEEEMQSLRETQIWVDILGPEKDDVHRILVQNHQGVLVDIGYSTYGQLVYELKIPLERSPDSPFAIDTSPGGAIGVGFKTGAMNMAAMRSQRPGGGMRGGGMPGGRPGGMAGGRPGGVRGGGMPGGGHRGAMPEPFTYWMKVALATGSQS